jgi:hypothetical protein
MLKSLDLLGNNVGFYNQNSSYLQTSFGGVSSLLIVTLFAVLIIGFGQDFFRRENPSFIKSSISLDKTPLFYVNNSNFTVAFRFEDFDVNPLDINDYFYVVAEYSTYIRNNTTNNMKAKFYTLDVVPCESHMFPQESSFAKNESYKSWYCPVINNLLLGGAFSDEFVGFFEMTAYVCKEGEKTPDEKKDCASDDKKIKLMNKLVNYAIVTQENIIDPSNYKEGLSPNLQTQRMSLDNNLLKSERYQYIESSMKTDYGWLIKDEKVIKRLGMVSKETRYSYYPSLIKGDFRGGMIGHCAFTFLQSQENYQRIYPKIQTLAAQVGGILTVFLQIGYIVVGTYNLHNKQLELSKLIIDDEIISINHDSSNQ